MMLIARGHWEMISGFGFGQQDKVQCSLEIAHDDGRYWSGSGKA
jgi:hypothetical protein